MTKQTALMFDANDIKRLTSISQKAPKKVASSPIRAFVLELYPAITRLRELGYNWQDIVDMYSKEIPVLSNTLDALKLRSAYSQVRDEAVTKKPRSKKQAVKADATEKAQSVTSALDDILNSK